MIGRVVEGWWRRVEFGWQSETGRELAQAIEFAAPIARVDMGGEGGVSCEITFGGPKCGDRVAHVHCDARSDVGGGAGWRETVGIIHGDTTALGRETVANGHSRCRQDVGGAAIRARSRFSAAQFPAAGASCCASVTTWPPGVSTTISAMP